MLNFLKVVDFIIVFVIMMYIVINNYFYEFNIVVLKICIVYLYCVNIDE